MLRPHHLLGHPDCRLYDHRRWQGLLFKYYTVNEFRHRLELGHAFVRSEHFKIGAIDDHLCRRQVEHKVFHYFGGCGDGHFSPSSPTKAVQEGKNVPGCIKGPLWKGPKREPHFFETGRRYFHSPSGVQTDLSGIQREAAMDC